jgi:hypothetical protein
VRVSVRPDATRPLHLAVAASPHCAPHPAPLAPCSRPSHALSTSLAPHSRQPLAPAPLALRWPLGTCAGTPQVIHGRAKGTHEHGCAVGARAPPLAAVSHPDGRNLPASASPSSILQMHVSSIFRRFKESKVRCKCFIWMLQ